MIRFLAQLAVLFFILGAAAAILGFTAFSKESLSFAKFFFFSALLLAFIWFAAIFALIGFALFH